MGDPAKETENDSVSMDGLEDVFDTKDTPVLRCENTEDNPTLSRKTTQDTPVLSVEEVTEDTTEDWTVKEAAEIFDCSEKTVLRKLRSGKLAGYKVQGEKTLEWRVRRDTKDNNVTPIETRQDKTVQDTGKLEELRGKIEKLEGQLQAAIYRNGYLEGKLEDREKQVLLLPDLQARAHQLELREQEITSLKSELETYRDLVQRSGWKKFWDWMIGKSN